MAYCKGIKNDIKLTRLITVGLAVMLLTSIEACDIKTANTVETTEVEADYSGSLSELSDFDWEGYYRDIIERNTDELIAAIAIEDYEGNGKRQAYVITTPEKLNIDGNVWIEDEFYMPTSLWYVKEDNCINVYRDEYGYSLVLVSGVLSDKKAVAAVGTETAWAVDRNYSGTIWGIEDGKPFNYGTTDETAAVYIIDGYIYAGGIVMQGEGSESYMSPVSYKYGISDRRLELIEKTTKN